MCFRPPSVESGESVCPGCYVVVLPNAEGKCPECGALMATPPGVPRGPSESGPPAASKAPGAPKIPPAPPKSGV